MTAAGLAAKVIDGGDDFVGFQFPSTLPSGRAELDIEYTGVVRKQDSSGIFRMLDNGNKYLYTQFENTDARDAFPCFDEPSYKVPWQLSLTIPSSDTALSNTAIVRKQKNGAQTTYTFGLTKPLSSYLIAFAVGPFDYVNAGKAGKRHIPVRIVTPKGHAEEAKYAASVTASIIDRLEDDFGIPFPYDKSDQVAIPVTFGFGAMENAGMVTYAQSIILAKPSVETTSRQRDYASTAAHELAHQWFGDLVTTAWWNDIWLNEAFATWMEQKLIREWKPEWNTTVNDVNDKLTAQGEDSLVSSRKIRQEILTKDDISNAFDDITYQKGAAVISMFENWVGPEAFRKGVSSYLTQYAFRTASAPEFLDAISSAGSKNVNQAFSSFLNQAGIPLVSMSLDCHQPSPTIHLEQQRYAHLGSDAAPRTWQIPLCIRYGSGAQSESACELMTQTSQDWTLKTASCPAWVEGNDRALGYYLVSYSPPLLKSLTENGHLSPAERVDLMGDVSSLAAGGKLAEADALSLVDIFSKDPQRQVVQSAFQLALAPREHEVPETLLPNYRRFLQKNFQACAREIGWTPRPGETEDVSMLRPSFLRLMSTWGDDQQLAAEAKVLADRWLKDHSALNPNLVVSILDAAAFSGDSDYFNRLIGVLNSTSDLQEREHILGALTQFRDPAAIQTGFEALLTGKIPFIEAPSLLFAGQSSASTRKMAFQFLQAHFDEILAKRPTGGGMDLVSALPEVGASYCDEKSKAELRAFFEPKADKLLGARRTLNQVLESIDGCIAQTTKQSPSVAAFLQNY
jgi:alanyl aminopeptidase